jgi:hypothetical protein
LGKASRSSDQSFDIVFIAGSENRTHLKNSLQIPEFESKDTVRNT